jgi:hypothetical protein
MDSKILNSEFLELNNIIKPVIASIKQINTYSNDIKLAGNDINQFLTNQKTFLSDILTTFNKLDSAIIQNWHKYVYIYNNLIAINARSSGKYCNKCFLRCFRRIINN